MLLTVEVDMSAISKAVPSNLVLILIHIGNDSLLSVIFSVWKR